MFEAVVFDMDGVILDSEKIYRKYEYVAAEQFGLDLSRVEEFCNKIAGGRYERNKLHFRDVFETDIPYDDYREVISKGVEGYAVSPGYDLKPGVVETLQMLKDKGLKLAIATSTDENRMKRFLGSTCRAGGSKNILEYFDAVICGDKVKKAKPDPDIYLTACRELGVDPARTVGVEDSVNGILSSAAAGLFTVMIIDLIQPTDEVREKADRIYTNMLEMHELFD